MRYLLVFLCVLSFCTFAGTARAYYDDSVVIEIGDVMPSEATDTSPTSDGTTTTNGGSGSSGADTGNTSSGTGTGTTAGASGASSNASGSGGSGGSATGGGTSGADMGGSQATPPDEQKKIVDGLFDVLVSEGAVTEGPGSGANNSAHQSPSNAPPTNGSGNGSGGNGASGAGTSAKGGTITISGPKVRAALLGKLSFKDILEAYNIGMRSAHSGGTRSNRDLSLMGASTILGDSNIDEILFGATRFEITYRSQGYILGFIPKSFPVRVIVDPQAVTPQRDVDISLPWYRFFLRTFFDTSSLTQEIQAVVQAEAAPQEGDSASDVQQRLFNAVTELLKKKFGTVEGSIQKN